MNKPWVVHYKNKFPGCRVDSSEHSLDVYSKDGEHLVAVKKNGAGQWVCFGEEMGLPYRHDLSPIAKEARVHKLYADGKIGFDELAEERKKVSASWVEGHQIESMEAYKQRKEKEKKEAAQLAQEQAKKAAEIKAIEEKIRAEYEAKLAAQQSA